MDMTLQTALAEAITQASGESFRPTTHRAVGGGDINQAAVLEGHARRYFVKTNNQSRLHMFEAESEGLREIGATASIHVPQPVCVGTHGAQAYLVLEFLELGHGNASSDRRLGLQLAELHRHTADRYGWRRDNTIGTTAQRNTRDPDWVRFYREHRLRYQLELAAANGLNPGTLQRGSSLLESLHVFFSDYHPSASLLHGDLWGGNHAVLRDGTPVVFDPAVYYGDREADLAMTELFGGYGADFYAAYQDAWPLDAGYRVRRNLYNLYHVLNHYNLFGGGYAGQAGALIERLLSEI